MPSARPILLWLLIALVVLPGSFFGTLRLIDQFLPGYGYDVARFPNLGAHQTLTFQNGENNGALIQGWSQLEPWGVWSDGNRAQLGFVIASALTGHPKLVIECKAFITQGSPEQRIELWSQNMKLGDASLRKDTNTVTVPLEGLRLPPGTPFIVELRLPLAKSPQQLGLSQDLRKLGIGLVRVALDE
ncbi:DUF7024 domain-containing protein [Bradyrhizobium sp. USDA 3311]